MFTDFVILEVMAGDSHIYYIKAEIYVKLQ
jgi:hypothetical protein